VTELHALILAAARLVDALDGQAQREDTAFRRGFELGFHHAADVAYRRAERELEEEWAAAVRRGFGGSQPRLHELIARGHIPRDLSRPPAVPRAWWTPEERAREERRDVA